MKRQFLGMTALTLVLSVSTGCLPGYNSMLFATKTNVGFEVDTQPPTISLDIGRQEGLLAPTYEGGKTPPAMASFRFKNENVFSTYLGSAFATGDAAMTMARLYDAADDPDLTNIETLWGQEESQWRAREGKFDSAVRLSQEPTFPWPMRQPPTTEVRPVLFGTDTSTGFKVKWSGTQGQIPDYVRLAYQRRELAFAGVSVGKIVKGEGAARKTVAYEVRVPSLLATVDADFEARDLADTDIGYLQYFASGRAATALALRQDVRKAMVRRLDPDQAARWDEETGELNRDPEVQERRQRIYAYLDDSSEVDLGVLADAERTIANRIEATDPPVNRGKINEQLMLDWFIERGLGEDLPDLEFWLLTTKDMDALDAAISELEIPAIE